MTAPIDHPDPAPRPEDSALNRQAAVFRVLGDPHRLRALHFLATAEPLCCANGQGVCACDLVQHLALSQPTVSHHMRLLVDAGLVCAEKRGRWTHYTLCPAGLEAAHLSLNPLLLHPFAPERTGESSCSTPTSF